MEKLDECKVCGEILKYEWETETCNDCLKKSIEAQNERIEKIKQDFKRGTLKIADIEFLIKFLQYNLAAKEKEIS
jgi:hypothetical protein